MGGTVRTGLSHASTQTCKARPQVLHMGARRRHMATSAVFADGWSEHRAHSGRPSRTGQSGRCRRSRAGWCRSARAPTVSAPYCLGALMEQPHIAAAWCSRYGPRPLQASQVPCLASRGPSLDLLNVAPPKMTQLRSKHHTAAQAVKNARVPTHTGWQCPHDIDAGSAPAA